MQWKEWSAFLAIGLFWGTSFFWIKIALEEISPSVLVAFRLLIASSMLILLMSYRKRRDPSPELKRFSFPRERRKIFGLLFLAIMNPFLPFLLITWGETLVDSAVAAVLNSTVPLFTILSAHWMLRDERMSAAKLMGLALGFSGVCILLSRDLSLSQFSEKGAWLGQLAVLMAAALYGYTTSFTKRYLHGIPALVQGASIMTGGCIYAWIYLLTQAPEPWFPHLGKTWFAVVWLGVLGSATAQTLYFYLLKQWGATRTAVVNYLLPVVGVFLGVVFLKERLEWKLVLGSLLILAGVAIVHQLKMKRRERKI